jgi:hypothetical protein
MGIGEGSSLAGIPPSFVAGVRRISFNDKLSTTPTLNMPNSEGKE